MDIPVAEFQILDNVIRDSIYRMNSYHLQKIDSSYSIDCFQYDNYKRPKIKIYFSRINSSTLAVWIANINRNPRKHTNGKYLIFIFDHNNQIKKVFETNWME